MNVERNFDPHKHRLFEVEATLSALVYVVASDREEAIEIAEAIGRTSLYEAAEEDMHAIQIEAHDPSRQRELPWGPIEYNGVELTVEQITEMIKNPPAEIPAESAANGQLPEDVHLVHTAMPLSTYTPVPEIEEWAAKRGYVIRSTRDE